MYPSQRRLAGTLLEDTQILTRLRIDIKTSRYHIHDVSGKLTTLKDIHNLRAGLHPKESETEAVLRVLQEFLENDRGETSSFPWRNETNRALGHLSPLCTCRLN